MRIAVLGSTYSIICSMVVFDPLKYSVLISWTEEGAKTVSSHHAVTMKDRTPRRCKT